MTFILLCCAFLHLQITKTADGYQPHLVSPERGLRLMATKALDQVRGQGLGWLVRMVGYGSQLA